MGPTNGHGMQEAQRKGRGQIYGRAAPTDRSRWNPYAAGPARNPGLHHT